MDKLDVKKENREKLKILAVPANYGGCSYYRILMPMEKLQEKFPDEVEVRVNLNPLGWDEKTKTPPQEEALLEDMEWADVVFTQNISNLGPQYMIALIKKSKDMGKFVHYDTDDLLTDLYEGHRLEGMYKKNKLDELTKVVYYNSDLVSVTQSKFAERISEFVRGTLVVIKNAIDYDLECWRYPRFKQPKKAPCRIGWVGGIHHEQDVKQIPNVVMSVNEKVGPQKVRWGFYGRPPLKPGEKGDWQQDVWDSYEKILTRGAKHRNWDIFPAAPSHKYGIMFTQIDVAIAPLEWNNFNDSKSEIKLMEAGRYGIPLVATDCGCYDEVIENGKTGFLISKDNPRSEWVRVLSRLVKDRDLREEMGANLKKITDERYNINNHIGERLVLYKKLLGWEDD